METKFEMHCIGCLRTPEQISEYVQAALEANMSPRHYVKVEEGTYNPLNGHFTCTECYLAMGAPSGPRGWKAP